MVRIGYRPGGPGDDAMALGHVLAGVIGTDAEPLTCESSSPRAVARELMEPPCDGRLDLLVVGSSERHGLGRVAFGDVMTTLLHEASCAVALAPAGYAKTDPLGLLRIAVAFDGGDESCTALHTGIALAERTRARLSVLTADDAATGSFNGPFSMMGAAQTVEIHRESMRRVLGQALERVPAELPVDARLLLGPAEEIATTASSDDLLITGSHGHGRFGRVVLGSVSTRLLAKAECPVLVLPGRAGSDPLGILCDGSGDANDANPSPEAVRG